MHIKSTLQKKFQNFGAMNLMYLSVMLLTYFVLSSLFSGIDLTQLYDDSEHQASHLLGIVHTHSSALNNPADTQASKNQSTSPLEQKKEESEETESAEKELEKDDFEEKTQATQKTAETDLRVDLKVLGKTLQNPQSSKTFCDLTTVEISTPPPKN